MTFIETHKRWIYPTLILLFLAPFTPFLDLAFENYFYSIGNDPISHFVSTPLTDFVYDFLPWPIMGFLAFCGLLFLLSFFALKPLRNPMMVIMLTTILGSGFLVHVAAKEVWGRPRPKQVENYGGNQAYRPIWKPEYNPPEPSKSFSCGHCTLGFVFFALYLIGIRIRSRYLQIIGLALALFLGFLFGFVRMAQGAHFFSDVLFSAYFMWIAALISDWLVYKPEELETAN